MEAEFFEIFEDSSKLQPIPTLTEEDPRTVVVDEFFENNTRHEAIYPYLMYKEICTKSSSGKASTTCDGAIKSIPRIPKLSAKQYKFSLDTFQNLSISAIEEDQSVLVSAHTSCGKTVVAEYAIAQAIKNNQRVVYTSPIKALSNQKFRELQEEFTDVGLMTGDVTLNPEASCLVMTTEILRNMLYKGSEVIREVHWIIFDEIHYMRDKSRGVVWEETIILLPRHVRMIFLSATIPNAREFAEWICYVQSQIVHVVYTEKRVIPLIHYFQTDKLYCIKDEKFRSNEFLQSMESVIPRKDLVRSIGEVLERINVPAVIFSFSRKDCEKFATSLTSGSSTANTARDFLSEDEKEMVTTIFNNAISSLREEDRNIPIIENMLPLLLRGIGIHHSGLLPIIKEIVEILFQESLVKVLFATETFSIGLNMPAKTVIFTSLKKFDGENRRILTSGEYIQMSGRAGRRGLDDKGVVISLITDKLETKQVKEMFSSNSDKLYSAFRLTYNMVLNLMRVEDLDPMYLLSRSFFHFQAYKNAIAQERELRSEMGNAKKPSESEKVAELKTWLQKREDLYTRRNQLLSSTFMDFIRMKGRVVDLMISRNGCPLFIRNAVVRSFRSADAEYITAYILTNNDIELKEFNIEAVCNVYDIRVKPDLRVFSKKFKLMEFSCELNDTISEIERHIFIEFPQIDLEHCLFCGKPSRACLIGCVTDQQSEHEQRNSIVREAIEAIQAETNQSHFLQKIEYLNNLREVYHMAECKKMINVLRRLGHLEGNTVLIKGKMASEISSGDELLLTEMIFGSNFCELPLMDMVALLSTTICEESPSDESVLSEDNERLIEILRASVHKISDVMNECGIVISEDEYISRFSFELMDIVKMWMSGYTFVEICNSTNAFEGSIIRTFKRLEELLRQLSNAAGVIGNTELMNMFGQGIYLIKRDIVFANSLYL